MLLELCQRGTCVAIPRRLAIVGDSLSNQLESCSVGLAFLSESLEKLSHVHAWRRWWWWSLVVGLVVAYLWLSGCSGFRLLGTGTSTSYNRHPVGAVKGLMTWKRESKIDGCLVRGWV